MESRLSRQTPRPILKCDYPGVVTVQLHVEHSNLPLMARRKNRFSQSPAFSAASAPRATGDANDGGTSRELKLLCCIDLRCSI